MDENKNSRFKKGDFNRLFGSDRGDPDDYRSTGKEIVSDVASSNESRNA